MVDVDGLFVGLAVKATKPDPFCPVTVTFPVTAVAFDGIPKLPATWNERAVPEWKVPLSRCPIAYRALGPGRSGHMSSRFRSASG